MNYSDIKINFYNKKPIKQDKQVDIIKNITKKLSYPYRYEDVLSQINYIVFFSNRGYRYYYAYDNTEHSYKHFRCDRTLKTELYDELMNLTKILEQIRAYIIECLRKHNIKDIYITDMSSNSFSINKIPIDEELYVDRFEPKKPIFVYKSMMNEIRYELGIKRYIYFESNYKKIFFEDDRYYFITNYTNDRNYNKKYDEYTKNKFIKDINNKSKKELRRELGRYKPNEENAKLIQEHLDKLEEFELISKLNKASFKEVKDIMLELSTYPEKQKLIIKERFDILYQEQQEKEKYEFILSLKTCSIYQLEDMLKQPLFYTVEQIKLIKDEIKHKRIREFTYEIDKYNLTQLRNIFKKSLMYTKEELTIVEDKIKEKEK